MDIKRECPCCESDDVYMLSWSRMLAEAHFVKCAECGMRGPEKPTEESALQAWYDLPDDDSEPEECSIEHMGNHFGLG